MKKNQAIRLVCFSLCIILVVAFLSQIFHYDKAHMRNRLYTYTQLEDDTVDGVIIGTSGIHCFWIPGQGYTENGIAMYTLTINGMQVYHILPMLKYAQKYQDIKVACIDMRPFLVSDSTENMEVRSRYFNELLPIYSPLRIETTNRTLKYMSQLTDTGRFDLSYYFCVLRYHDMWQDDLNFGVLESAFTNTYGYLLANTATKVKTLPERAYTDETQDIQPYCLECLEELIAYADENDIELIFVHTPHYIDEDAAARNNWLIEYLTENGIPYMDCNSKSGVQTYPFDNETDFYDKNHANYAGASKFTSYLGEYLATNHRDLFPDRRTDSNYDCWAKAYKKMLQKAVNTYGVDVDIDELTAIN